jgi:hypothetical protein
MHDGCYGATGPRNDSTDQGKRQPFEGWIAGSQRLRAITFGCQVGKLVLYLAVGGVGFPAFGANQVDFGVTNLQQTRLHS